MAEVEEEREVQLQFNYLELCNQNSDILIQHMFESLKIFWLDYIKGMHQNLVFFGGGVSVGLSTSLSGLQVDAYTGSWREAQPSLWPGWAWLPWPGHGEVLVQQIQSGNQLAIFSWVKVNKDSASTGLLDTQVCFLWQLFPKSAYSVFPDCSWETAQEFLRPLLCILPSVRSFTLLPFALSFLDHFFILLTSLGGLL